MPGPTLPASFISSHGRAKLEYILSATTTARKGLKSIASNTFVLNPSPPTTTFQMYQHSFNVNVLKGGAPSELTASIRNIITVALEIAFIDVGILSRPAYPTVDAESCRSISRRTVQAKQRNHQYQLKTIDPWDKKYLCN